MGSGTTQGWPRAVGRLRAYQGQGWAAGSRGPLAPPPTPTPAAPSLFSWDSGHKRPGCKGCGGLTGPHLGPGSDKDGARLSFGFSACVCACVRPAPCNLLFQGVSRSGFEGKNCLPGSQFQCVCAFFCLFQWWNIVV